MLPPSHAPPRIPPTTPLCYILISSRLLVGALNFIGGIVRRGRGWVIGRLNDDYLRGGRQVEDAYALPVIVSLLVVVGMRRFE